MIVFEKYGVFQDTEEKWSWLFILVLDNSRGDERVVLKPVFNRINSRWSFFFSQKRSLQILRNIGPLTRCIVWQENYPGQFGK